MGETATVPVQAHGGGKAIDHDDGRKAELEKGLSRADEAKLELEKAAKKAEHEARNAQSAADAVERKASKKKKPTMCCRGADGKVVCI